MERKIQRQTVIISQVLDATARFTININCDFNPDEMRVKQISYCDNAVPGAAPGSFVLYCDTLARGPLGCFVDPCVSFTGMSYDISSPVRGAYEFRVALAGAPTARLNNGHLNIILEFRRRV
jgi:hypothetical protein